MATATIQTQSRRLSTKTQKVEQPKKLSKAGQWLRDNPGGIIRVLDRRAVNR